MKKIKKYFTVLIIIALAYIVTGIAYRELPELYYSIKSKKVINRFFYYINNNDYENSIKLLDKSSHQFKRIKELNNKEGYLSQLKLYYDSFDWTTAKYHYRSAKDINTGEIVHSITIFLNYKNSKRNDPLNFNFKRESLNVKISSIEFP